MRGSTHEPTLSQQAAADSGSVREPVAPSDATTSVVAPAEHEHDPLTREQHTRLEKAIEEDGYVISRIMGLRGVDFRLGDGWKTDMEAGIVYMSTEDLIDPELPDEWNEHGILHELAAHLRTRVNEPLTARRENEFARRGKPYHFFNNIMTDIKGNKLIMSTLPRMQAVTNDLYREYLFRNDDLRAHPLHVQMMEAMIMEEMSPGRQVMVSDEVRAALAALRHYDGTEFDIIKHVTRPRKSMTESVSALESFELAKQFILPVYEELLAADRERFGDQLAEHAADGGGDEGSDFSGHYDEAMGKQHKHHKEDGSSPASNPPGQKSPPDKLDTLAKEIRKAEDNSSRANPEKRRRRAIEQEINRPYADYAAYITRMGELSEGVQEMAEFFRTIVSERSSKVRKLSRPTAEGSILDPNTLAQTYVDVQAQNPAPPAYLDYEWREREREVSGRFDVFLALDVSISMANSGSAPHAADSALLVMEGLDIFHTLIQDEQAATGLELDLDVRSAVYTFGKDCKCTKPLGRSITRKERVQSYIGARNAEELDTQDFLALEAILEVVRSETEDTSRKRIMFFVADGGSSDQERLQIAVDALKQHGVVIIPIGIGEAAAKLRDTFGEDTELLEDATALPGYVTRELQKEVRV